MRSICRTPDDLVLRHHIRCREPILGDNYSSLTSSSTQPSPAPGSRFPRTANIFPVTPAANPSTCLAYCSTCLLFSRVSNLPGSCGSLNSLCHSSSGNGLCFASALLAFSDFRFCCHAVILACSRASCL